MTAETAAPADTGPAEAVEAAPTASSAISEIAALGRDVAFHDDFTGSNGRAAQVAAVERKSALHKQAYGPAPDPVAVLPERVQDGLEAPDAITKQAATAMIPGASPADYKFNWTDAANTDIEALQSQNNLAAEASFAIGASPEYAKATIAGMESMIASSRAPATAESLDVALQRSFGANSDATVEAARTALLKMPQPARDWFGRALDKLDAAGATWAIGRLASVTRATTPRE